MNTKTLSKTKAGLGFLRISCLLLIPSFLTFTSARAISSGSEHESLLSQTLARDSRGLRSLLQGRSCHPLTGESLGLPCNPADIATELPSQTYAGFFWSNQIGYLQEAKDLARGSANADTVRQLFQETEPNALQSQLELGYRTATFGFSVIPQKVHFFSQFRNAPSPEIQIFASQDTTARVQIGSYLGNDINLGVEIRGEQRRWLESQFFLTDIIAEGREEYLSIHKGESLIIEPGMTIEPEDAELFKRWSAGLKNWGFYGGPLASHRPSLELVLGTSLEQEWIHSLWTWTVQMDLSQTRIQSKDILSGAARVRFGILQLFGEVSRSHSGLGFQVQHKSLIASLSFSSTEPLSTDQSSTRQDRIFTEIGVGL